MRVVRTSVLSGTDPTGESSGAFRVGVITSGKGYLNEKFAEVNSLRRKNLEYLTLASSWQTRFVMASPS